MAVFIGFKCFYHDWCASVFSASAPKETPKEREQVTHSLRPPSHLQVLSPSKNREKTLRSEVMSTVFHQKQQQGEPDAGARGGGMLTVQHFKLCKENALCS